MDDTAVDLTLLEALLVYFDYGLDPGSGGMAVLMHDEELARQKLHEHSKHTARNMVLIVKHLFPAPCSGSKEKIVAWMNHNGHKGWDTTEGVLYRLTEQKQEPIKDLKRQCNYTQM